MGSLVYSFSGSLYTDQDRSFDKVSADLLSIATPSFFNPLYAGLDYPRRVIGTNLEEGISYVGILGAALALIGVIRFRRARWWLLLAFIAWGLSLGPLPSPEELAADVVGIDDMQNRNRRQRR